MLETWCPYVFLHDFICLQYSLGKEGKGRKRREEGREGKARGGEGRGGEKENQTSLVSDASSHVLGVNVLFTKVLWVQEFGGMRG